MWKDLSREWKETYELAWIAFCNGSLPIGCIITDAAGDTIIAGRNETCENHYPNRRTAHAEMYCMRNIDIKKFPSLKEYHLYTTMEPCPMCMGTIVMAAFRRFMWLQKISIAVLCIILTMIRGLSVKTWKYILKEEN